MPDTRPGVYLDDSGVCNGCRHAEHKKTVDWVARKAEFEKICDKYRRKGNEYDCLIAVSSGKDSYYQVWMMKEEMKMNPLLVSVDNLDWTRTGEGNFQNLLDTFSCDCLVFRNDTELHRKMSRIGFEHDGFIAWLWDRLVYTYPIWVAIKMNIPFVIYGEDVNVEYGGSQTREIASALDQINNDVVRDYGWKLWTNNGISKDELVMAQYPSAEEVKRAKLDPQYLSYYFKWSGYEHMELAKKYGWKSLNDTGEWKREGFIEDYDQIDDMAYLVDPWLKYPKYGHARATDVSCYWIREGRISREEGVELVKEHDHKIDPLALGHYLSFSGYTKKEFWNIVEKFWNRNVFEKVNGKWRLKCPIWKQK